MKTKTVILAIIFTATGVSAFSLNQGKSYPVPSPSIIASGNEKYVSIDGDIYKIDTANKSEVPVKININTKYEESNPVLSSDRSTLYFVSDRKGGYGGKDIWASERLSDGSWSKPYNLGSQINSCKDEDHPVILKDGVTLVFTSNGRNASNENETFSSTMNDEGLWSLPEKTE